MRISIVTPNRNHAPFLAQTMDSVLAADHGNLDYIVIDGASSDASLAIIEARRTRLTAFVSEPDQGVYDAVNKGFARADGDVMGWINAGDALFPDTLSLIDEIFSAHPRIEWLTSRVVSFLDAKGRLVEQGLHSGVTRESFLAGEHLPGFSRGRGLSMVQQEATFWRRSLWERAGGRLETSLRLAADFELWCRFFDHTDLWSVSAPLGAFRRHPGQLSETGWAAYLDEAAGVLRTRGRRPRPALLQTARVAARRLVPAPVRPWAHRLGVFAPAPVCFWDPQTRHWHCTVF